MSRPKSEITDDVLVVVVFVVIVFCTVICPTRPMPRLRSADVDRPSKKRANIAQQRKTQRLDRYIRLCFRVVRCVLPAAREKYVNLDWGGGTA